MTCFFSNRIGKGADNITHHRPMTALSKTPSRCPARPGAGSGLACLATFPFTTLSESPAFPQVEARCSHQAGGLPYLDHLPGSKVPAGWAGAEQAPSSAPAKVGEEGGEAGSGFSTLADLLLLISLPHVARLVRPQPANQRTVTERWVSRAWVLDSLTPSWNK